MELTYNNVFKWCVELLYVLAEKTGTTYEEINVIIFCIITPIVLLTMAIWIFYLLLRISFLKKLDALRN